MSENEIVDLDALLLRWPVEPVPRHLISQQAHHHAVEFKKQSGASSERIDELMAQFNDGADLDRYFEKRLESEGSDREG